MSHFTVMVIGENPEEQLAPYDENLEVLEYLREDGSKTTYNPKSKWDWYLLGGRWTGFLRLKPGRSGKIGQPGIMTATTAPGYADAALLEDIDIEAMRDEAEMKMREKIVKIGSPRDWRAWEELESEYPNVEDRRAVYWAQKDLARVKAALGDPFLTLDHLRESDEELITSARQSALHTFAVVKDGQWYERGKMGWWACVSNEKNSEEWNREFERLIDGLPPETLISIYDCHI